MGGHDRLAAVARKTLRQSRKVAPPLVEDQDLSRFVGCPVEFMRALVDPETDEHFDPYPAQERFLEEALTLTDRGTLPYPELVFSAPKKSGKTTFAAVILLYVMRVIGGRRALGLVLANDYDQSVGRVYAAAKAIIEASPILRGTADTWKDKADFRDGTLIEALPSDYAGAAGANPNISVFDELWGFTSESATRLWDEMVPPPTRAGACRLTVTYAGFEGESELLEKLYKRGLEGEQIDTDLYSMPGELLMFWTHEPPAPWQTVAWVAQMRTQLRTNAFLRMIENRWVTAESDFVEMDWWDACVDPEASPELQRSGMLLWLGVDASVKRDSTAIVGVTWDDQTRKVRQVLHHIFQPSQEDPLDFEATIEATLKDLATRFVIMTVWYDPYQLVSSAQRLTAVGLPMEEYPQTTDRLTAMSSNLYDLIKGRNFTTYPDEDVRLAVSRAVAVENPRGWRIAKTKASHKIDVVIALAMACLACVKGTPWAAADDFEEVFDHGLYGGFVL